MNELRERTEKATSIAMDMLEVVGKHKPDTDMLYSAMQIVNDAINYQRKLEDMARYAVAQSPIMPRVY
jgi:hypothetical protein